MVDKKFIEEALSELKDVQKKQLEDNDQVGGLIAHFKRQHKTLKFGDVELQIHTTLSKQDRRLLSSLDELRVEASKEGSDVSPEEVLTTIEAVCYTVLAHLCADAPYTDPKTWRYIDDETSLVIELATFVFENLDKEKSKIVEFRPV